MNKLRTALAGLGKGGRAWPLAVAIVCLAPFAPLLVPDGRGIAVPFAFDYSCYQLPTREFARDEILAGRFPLWLPYLACGTPLHATQQASLCYPLLTPLVVAFGAGYGINASLFLHLLLCFVGEYMLARKLDISPPAASLAALAATWSMHAMNHFAVGHVAMVLGYGLVPWFFYALAALLRRPGPLPAAGLAGIAGCLAVVGHPQLPYYTFVAGACWACASLAAGAASVRRAAALGWFCAAVCVGGLLSAVQLLPVLELARNGTDGPGHQTAHDAGLWAMDGGDLLGLVLPNAKGSELARLPELETSQYLHERGAYLGVCTLALAVYSLSRATTARWQRGTAWLCLFACLFAAGESTPLFRYFGMVFPGAFSFRCPGRVFGVITPLAALLAGCGADALARRDAPGTRGLRLLFGAWLIASLGFFVSVVWHWLAGVGASEYLAFVSTALQRQIVVAVIALALTCAVIWLAPRWRQTRPGAVYAALALLLAADLYTHNVIRFRLGPRGVSDGPAKLLAIEPPMRMASTPEWPRVRPEHLRYSGLAPAALAWRRSAIDTFDGGILPSGVDRLYTAVALRPSVALALAACDYHFVQRDGDWKPVRGALPRIRLLCGIERGLLETSIEELDEGELALIRESIVGQVNIARDDAQGLRLRVDAPREGALVVADMFYPGWRVHIDGKADTIRPAHGVFRAVWVAAGRHEVEFTFAPRSFQAGMAASLCGLLIVATMAVWGWLSEKTLMFPRER